MIEIQKHCPNKMIVNNLSEDLHFIYLKDLKEKINPLLNSLDCDINNEDDMNFNKNTFKLMKLLEETLK